MYLQLRKNHIIFAPLNLKKIIVKISYSYEKNIPTFAKKEKKQTRLPRKNGNSKR